jgi:hypothetical protein
MGLKRKKNAISLKKMEEEKNTPLWPRGSSLSPASFVGAGTSHTITISPVEQRDIVSKKNKKKTNKKKKKKTYEGTQDMHPESPLPLLCLWGS